MNAFEKLREISEELLPSGIEAVEKEAEFLITRGLNVSLAELYTNNPELDDRQVMVIDEMVARRSRREPLQYITGYNDFLGLRLHIGYGVLIPRPETELMAEDAVKAARGQRSWGSHEKQNTDYESKMTVLDLCTGSGCLALALAKELPSSRVFGIDISETAMSYARMNARINGIDNVSFIHGDLFEPLVQNELFDLIISNPPYIRTGEIQTLQPEIRDWEPLNALDGGPDGMDFYRRIVPAARKYLKRNGVLMFEVGCGCADTIARMLEGSGYADMNIRKDYAGIKRIIQAKWTR